MERLGCTCLRESSNEKNGKVGMYLKEGSISCGSVGMCFRESSMNKWQGWDVLGGKFDDRMERLVQMRKW